MRSKLHRFIKGMGSAMDLGATSSPSHTRTGQGLKLERSCAEALGADWRKLAQDFDSAWSKTVKDGNGNVKSE
jgi:hypothetical protein